METNSDVESLSDEYEDDHCSDSEGSYQYQVSELPANFLGAVIHRRLQIQADQQPLQSRPASTNNECGGSPTNGNTNTTASITDDVNDQPEKGSENNNNSSHGPPSPWGTSKSKQRVIDELTDETSDIHLLIGHFTPKDFKNVNFKQILQKYAGNQYKMSNFRNNMKLLLKHHLSKTGPFKVEGVEPWYTSVNNVSRAYSLLFMLYIDPTKCDIISGMTAEQIYESHPQFQLYEPDKFKIYNQNMKTLTGKRKNLISEEEASFKRDMLKLPRKKNK